MLKRMIPLSLIVLIAGCAALAPTPQAEFQITSWEQDYREYFDNYGNVYIYYEITNTGTVMIDYYKVYFQVSCTDGSTYQDWDNGSDILPGHTISDWTIINTAQKQATNVAVAFWELLSY